MSEFSLSSGDSISYQRVGGGVRVAVIEFDSENPIEYLQKVVDLKRGREACQMPFDNSEPDINTSPQ